MVLVEFEEILTKPLWAGIEKKHRINSQKGGTSKQVSYASERANKRASGPLLQSVFLVILAHSAMLLYSLNPPEFTH